MAKNIAPAVADLRSELSSKLLLLQWIESARNALDGLQAAAALDPEFEARLRDSGIAFNTPWGDEESVGLTHLMTEIHSDVLRLADVAGGREAANG